jgi:hypothetical protein
MVTGISNLWKWRKVIWNDRDWDWVYLSKIIIFKLEKMEASTKHWTVHRAERDAKEMRIVAEILRKINSGDIEYSALRAFVGDDDYSRAKLCHEAEDDLFNYGLTLLRRKMRNWWD